MIQIRDITDRRAWLAWRHEALTASDIGAVAGVDPYRSPLAVYAEKSSFDIATAETNLMIRGRHFEAAAVEYLRENHPEWTISRPAKFYIDTDLKLGATPDCFANDEDGRLVNIQIKTISKPTFESWNGKAPTGYLLQTVTENMLTGADTGLLAVLSVSTYDAELHEFTVERHAGAEARICDIAREFWSHLDAGFAPRPDYSRDADIITQLYPPDPDVPAPLDMSKDNRIYELLEDRERCKSEIKLLTADVKTLEAELIDKLHGAEKAICNDWKISRTIIHVPEQLRAATSFPRLTVTRTKED